jgi:predicted dehydrogenase
MRVGIVGAGLQAKRRAPVLKGFPDTELVLISAEHLESARSLASQVGCEADVGWEWVSKRDDIDAVLVCTPPHLHAAISIASLKSGKHVLCEKPLARTLEEATEMLAVAQSVRRCLKCGFNHRHHPGVNLAKRWLDGGRIGDPLFVRCRYGICGRPGHEREWRANPLFVGGGQLMEQGIHAVDLSRWFLGDVCEVNCFLGTQYLQTGDLEDNAFALFRTVEGRVASIHSSLMQWKNLFSFEIFGREGYLVVEGLGGSYGTERVAFGKRDFSAPFTEEVIEFRGEDRSWLEEWREFVGAIQEGREPIGSAADGVEAMRLVLVAYEAARLRTTIKVDRVKRG